MWALAIVALATALGTKQWLRSGQPWKDFWGLRLARLYAVLWHRCRGNGLAPFPLKGPALVLANHTCSADPMFLLSGSNRILSFVVAREHFRLSSVTHAILTWMRCVPVTRGGQDACAVRMGLRRLSEGYILCIFPEGNLSGVARGRLRPGRAGIALLALRSRAPVYPAYIAGGPRTINLLRSWLCPSRVPVQVVYGRQVDLSAYYDQPINRKTLEEVTALLMGHVAALEPRTRSSKTGFSCQPKRLP
jgi:1-acyl-sn-glycerol-3-phosphate acyltransferase